MNKSSRTKRKTPGEVAAGESRRGASHNSFEGQLSRKPPSGGTQHHGWYPARSISSRPDVFIVLAWAAIILAYVAFRANMVDIPLNRDEGFYGYIGQLILHHGMPYRDALENKPPIVFYLYSLALLFVPPTARGIHIFLQVYNFITLVTLFILARTYFRSTIAGLWTAFVYALFSASPIIEGFAASTEMFMVLPLTLSLLFAVLAARKENMLFACLSGLAGALACWTKQIAVFSIAFGFIYMALYRPSVARGIGTSAAKTKRMLIAGWGLGAVGISVLIVAYFFFAGVLKEFYYWSFTHNFYYASRFDLTLKIGMFTNWFTHFISEDFLIVALGPLYSLYALTRKDKRAFFTLGFLGFSCLGLLPGAEYLHYFALIAPALSLAAGFGISELITLIPAKRRKAASLACGIMLMACPLVINSRLYIKASPAEISRFVYGNNPFPESIKVARYIADNSLPHDRVLILGSEPEILFYAQRRSATPFVMIYPLTFIHPRYREFQERLLKNLSDDPPKFIFLVQIPASWAWDGKADLSVLVTQVRQLLKRDYRLKGKLTIDGEGNNAIFLYQKVHVQVP
jgi:hypothetical protein